MREKKHSHTHTHTQPLTELYCQRCVRVRVRQPGRDSTKQNQNKKKLTILLAKTTCDIANRQINI